jgi:hypothetical protein
MLNVVAPTNKNKIDTRSFNEGKSAVSFYQQGAACVPDMFSNFYLVKNHKIAINSTTS